MAKNIILIGMPGAGKSTVGVLLAKQLALHFMDTDVFIQGQERRSLQDIINQEGLGRFRELEDHYLQQVQADDHVIATGGSAVYYPDAMTHLKALGTVIYLDVPLSELESRITNFATRGLAITAGQDLADIYGERLPLYRRYADITIAVTDKTQNQVVEAIAKQLAATN